MMMMKKQKRQWRPNMGDLVISGKFIFSKTFAEDAFLQNWGKKQALLPERCVIKESNMFMMCRECGSF
jgi:hypothetical protein